MIVNHISHLYNSFPTPINKFYHNNILEMRLIYIMKDIKKLYLAAKQSGKTHDVDAYVECVREFLESNPFQYISNLEYIISSSIGLSTLKEFVDYNGISIASYNGIMDCLTESAKQCRLRSKSDIAYQESIDMMKSYKHQYQNCFTMFEAFQDDIGDRYIEAYYKNFPVLKNATTGQVNMSAMISRFGESCIPDMLIYASIFGNPNVVLESLEESDSSDKLFSGYPDKYRKIFLNLHKKVITKIKEKVQGDKYEPLAKPEILDKILKDINNPRHGNTDLCETHWGKPGVTLSICYVDNQHGIVKEDREIFYELFFKMFKEIFNELNSEFREKDMDLELDEEHGCVYWIHVTGESGAEINKAFESKGKNQSKTESSILYQWISESVKDIHNISPIITKSIRSKSLDAIVESAQARNNMVYRESVLTGNDHIAEYTESEIHAMEDLLSLKEYQLTCMENADRAIELQKEIYSLYESFDGLVEDVATSVIPMLPGSQQKVTTNLAEGSLSNTRNKKTGEIPDYLKRNHDLGYGEDDPVKKNEETHKGEAEPTLDDFKRPSAEGDHTKITPYDYSQDDSKSDEGTTGEEDDVEDKKHRVNNYYYYTYTNSNNRNSNSFNRHHQDDHSNNKRIHSNDSVNNALESAFGEAFIEVSMSLSLFIVPIIFGIGAIAYGVYKMRKYNKACDERIRGVISSILGGVEVKSSAPYNSAAAKYFQNYLNDNEDKISSILYKPNDASEMSNYVRSYLAVTDKAARETGSRPDEIARRINEDTLLFSSNTVITAVIKREDLDKKFNELNKNSYLKIVASEVIDFPTEYSNTGWELLRAAGLITITPRSGGLHSKRSDGTSNEGKSNVILKQMLEDLSNARDKFAVIEIYFIMPVKDFLLNDYPRGGNPHTESVLDLDDLLAQPLSEMTHLPSDYYNLYHEATSVLVTEANALAVELRDAPKSKEDKPGIITKIKKMLQKFINFLIEMFDKLFPANILSFSRLEKKYKKSEKLMKAWEDNGNILNIMNLEIPHVSGISHAFSDLVKYINTGKVPDRRGMEQYQRPGKTKLSIYFGPYISDKGNAVSGSENATFSLATNTPVRSRMVNPRAKNLISIATYLSDNTLMEAFGISVKNSRGGDMSIGDLTIILKTTKVKINTSVELWRNKEDRENLVTLLKGITEVTNNVYRTMNQSYRAAIKLLKDIEAGNFVNKDLKVESAPWELNVFDHEQLFTEGWKDVLKDGFSKVKNLVGMTGKKKSLNNLQLMDLPSERKKILPPFILGINQPIKGVNVGSMKESIDIDEFLNNITGSVLTESTEFPNVTKNDVKNICNRFKQKFGYPIIFVNSASPFGQLMGQRGGAVMMAITKEQLEILEKKGTLNIDQLPKGFLQENYEKVIMINTQYLFKTGTVTAASLEETLKHEYGHVMTYEKITDDDWIEYMQKSQWIMGIETVVHSDDYGKALSIANCCYHNLKPEKLANEYSNVNYFTLIKSLTGQEPPSNWKDISASYKIIDLKIPSDILAIGKRTMLNPTSITTNDTIRCIDYSLEVYDQILKPGATKNMMISALNDVRKLQLSLAAKGFSEAVGDSDDQKPSSDNPIQDTMTDLDRKLASTQQAVKKKVQGVVNTGRTIAKPFKRTSMWISNMVANWKDANENDIKERLADPHQRSNLFTAVRSAIKYGSLMKAGLLLNPIVLYLTLSKKWNKSGKESRLRAEMIGELKAELQIIDAKITDADRAGDNKAKYQLMRFKNELNKKLIRVGGTEVMAKMV